jgi:hypothetical protein
VHRLVWGSADPPLTGRRRAGHRGQSARQGHPAPTRQDRPGRRRSRRPSGALWSRDRHRQDRQWTGGGGPDVQARQGFCGHLPHPGHQAAQSRAGGRRPSAARVAVGAEHAHPHPPMRPARHRCAHRYHQRRGLDPAAAGPPDRRPHRRSRRPPSTDHQRRQHVHAKAPGTQTASAPTAPPLCSSPPGTTPSGSTAKHPWPHCAAPARSRPPWARPAAPPPTEAATGRQAPPCTASPCPVCAGIPAPATTSTDASPRAKPLAKRSAASSATSLASSTRSSSSPDQPNHGPLSRLTSIGHQAEAQVPADRDDDDLGWEAAAGEGGLWTWSRTRTARSHADSLAAQTRPRRTQQRPLGLTSFGSKC